MVGEFTDSQFIANNNEKKYVSVGERYQYTFVSALSLYKWLQLYHQTIPLSNDVWAVNPITYIDTYW